jgi:chemotaxis protein methyltransferase CheR
VPRLVIGSQFLLDREPWEVLRLEVLPRLARERSPLRVWSAGCHQGKEPYSLAILLAELRGDGDHYLLATDRDAALLEVARAGGPYSANDVDTLSERQMQSSFEPGGPPYRVVRRLRERVTVREHDLLTDPYEGDFDLVLFRDVEPFNTSTVNRALYQRLHGALRPGGVLFVGSTDAVPGWQELGLRRIGPCLYER